MSKMTKKEARELAMKLLDQSPFVGDDYQAMEDYYTVILLGEK